MAVEYAPLLGGAPGTPRNARVGVPLLKVDRLQILRSQDMREREEHLHVGTLRPARCAPPELVPDTDRRMARALVSTRPADSCSLYGVPQVDPPATGRRHVPGPDRAAPPEEPNLGAHLRRVSGPMSAPMPEEPAWDRRRRAPAAEASRSPGSGRRNFPGTPSVLEEVVFGGGDRAKKNAAALGQLLEGVADGSWGEAPRPEGKRTFAPRRDSISDVVFGQQLPGLEDEDVLTRLLLEGVAGVKLVRDAPVGRRTWDDGNGGMSQVGNILNGQEMAWVGANMYAGLAGRDSEGLHAVADGRRIVQPAGPSQVQNVVFGGGLGPAVLPRPAGIRVFPGAASHCVKADEVIFGRDIDRSGRDGAESYTRLFDGAAGAPRAVQGVRGAAL